MDALRVKAVEEYKILDGDKKIGTIHVEGRGSTWALKERTAIFKPSYMMHELRTEQVEHILNLMIRAEDNIL